MYMFCGAVNLSASQLTAFYLDVAGVIIMDNLPEVGFVRLTTILKIIPISKSTWWLGVKSGKFPSPVKLSARIVGWKVKDIQELIKQLEVQK